jgi:hypothetical protein
VPTPTPAAAATSAIVAGREVVIALSGERHHIGTGSNAISVIVTLDWTDVKSGFPAPGSSLGMALAMPVRIVITTSRKKIPI